MPTAYMSIKKTNKVIVVGGGAAGMMSAIWAGQAGAQVTLLEKNEKLGKKIYITGKGRCNMTNDCDGDAFMRCVPRNPRFLFAALRTLPPQELMAFMEANGCPVKVERGRRVFPVSDKASDVTRTLEKAMRRLNVDIRFNAAVSSVLTERTDAGERVRGVALADGTQMLCDRVVVATGGLSYPSTGSTGDGYRFAAEAGLSVTDTVPSLTGFQTAESWPAQLQGLSLKNVALHAALNGKSIFRQTGEMLFTHYGVSGPLVIELSSLVCDRPLSGVSAYLDLKPGMDEKQLDARLVRDFSAAGKKHVSSLLTQYLPQRLAALFPEMAKVDGGKTAAQVSAGERRALVGLMKRLPLTLTALRPFAEAIVTRGGVSVKEINASTMEAKKVTGLYFAGEVLDVDAFTGGYNLQIAFSTGALAGKSAGEADETNAF